jgi:hypothetical protein
MVRRQTLSRTTVGFWAIAWVGRMSAFGPVSDYQQRVIGKGRFMTLNRHRRLSAFEQRILNVCWAPLI